MIKVTVEEYIRNKPRFEMMPYMTIYIAISEMIKDGIIPQEYFK
jgi:hypothetical protein